MTYEGTGEKPSPRWPRTFAWSETVDGVPTPSCVYVPLVEADEKLAEKEREIASLRARAENLDAQLRGLGRLTNAEETAREHRARSADRL